MDYDIKNNIEEICLTPYYLAVVTEYLSILKFLLDYRLPDRVIME